MSTTAKLIRIDASSLAHATCFLRFYRHVVEGYRAPKKKIDMEFGSAYHIFREELAFSEDKDKAIAKAVTYFNTALTQCAAPSDTKKYLTPGYLIQLCVRYVDMFGANDAARDFQYIRDDQGKPLVEQTFSIEFYHDENIKVLLQGTIDEIGKFRNGGCLAFGDDKTTGSYKADIYLAEHEMKNQLLTYAFALNELRSKSTLHREVFAGRIGGFINGVFLKPDISKVEFKRSKIFYYTGDDLCEYHSMLTEICRRLSRTIANVNVNGEHSIPREGRLNNTCSGNYGECSYVASCRIGGSTGERLLKQNFISEEYTPLMFRKAKVEV